MDAGDRTAERDAPPRATARRRPRRAASPWPTSRSPRRRLPARCPHRARGRGGRAGHLRHRVPLWLAVVGANRALVTEPMTVTGSTDPRDAQIPDGHARHPRAQRGRGGPVALVAAASPRAGIDAVRLLARRGMDPQPARAGLLPIDGLPAATPRPGVDQRRLLRRGSGRAPSSPWTSDAQHRRVHRLWGPGATAGASLGRPADGAPRCEGGRPCGPSGRAAAGSSPSSPPRSPLIRAICSCSRY